MFIDILWSWAAERHLARDFYPALVPGKSVLVHQDFVYPFSPWIILGMGLAKDIFRFSYNVQYSSAVFDVLKPPQGLPDPQDISLDTASEIYDDFINQLEGWAVGSVTLGKVLYIASRGKFTTAESLFEWVKAQYASEALVMQYVPGIGSLLKQARDTGVAPDIAHLRTSG
jgi:hypothetical protein